MPQATGQVVPQAFSTYAVSNSNKQDWHTVIIVIPKLEGAIVIFNPDISVKFEVRVEVLKGHCLLSIDQILLN